jgi:hypothetical protein
MKSSEATVVFSVCCNDIFYFALIWLSLCSFPFSRNVSVVGTHVGFVYWTELKLGATVGRKQAPPTVVTSRDFTYCILYRNMSRPEGQMIDISPCAHIILVSF